MDVAHRIVTKHFMPDLIGNLGAFSGQKVRCTKCGEVTDGWSLTGRCYCGNSLTMTVAEGSVKKYLRITKLIGKEYGLPDYTRQRIGLMESSIQSMFGGTIDEEDISIDEFILEKENAKRKGEEIEDGVLAEHLRRGRLRRRAGIRGEHRRLQCARCAGRIGRELRPR